MPNTRPELWRNLPAKPGVYLFKDAAGSIIYVGKAINLKKRVSSYFLSKHADRPWTAVMVGLIEDLETIVVSNEVEALMLEATLIKQHMPRFNIRLTDDKAYPYIKVVWQEPIPRFTIARKRVLDAAQYFGPYLSARAAVHTLEFLRRLYGIHISPKLLRADRDRACLSCQLGGFACPLHGEVDEQAYRERTMKAVEFLQGKRKRLKDDLEEAMVEAAKNEQFELAAKMRDRLKAVEHILNRQQVISKSQDDYDAIGSYQTNTQAVATTLRVREGRVTGQKSFFFDIVGDETPSDLVRTFLISIYHNFSDLPGTVVIADNINDQTVIERFLQGLAGRRVTLHLPSRGDKRALLEMATKNARSKLEMKLLKTDDAFTGLIALQELLDLAGLPERIEAVDISNLGTSEPVGATVCFLGGVPNKNEYRRYKIRTVPGQNDFAMIREVVKRRFSDTSRATPDLFVVDGGPEQLQFALQGLDEAPLKPGSVIALAKKPDRIFLPGRKMPIAAPRGHKGLLLLSRLRDEVHRFAIQFQRQRQSRRSLSTQE
jgi:excinuclease ABC subunit C